MKLDLSRREIAILKGLSIMCIVLHNYAHFIPGTISENEFEYDYTKAVRFFNCLTNVDSYLILNFFSFLGHYGVSVFVFASGYGLVKKYESQPVMPSFSKFMGYNLLKLYKLLVPGLAIFFIVKLCCVPYFVWPKVYTLQQLTFIVNFLSYHDWMIKIGPYWYFSLMVQLYLLYRLWFHKAGKAQIVTLALLSVPCQIIVGELLLDDLRYIHLSFVGSLLPFCMGIYAARYPVHVPSSKVLQALVLIVAFVLVIAMGMNYYSWFFVPAIWVIGSIVLLKLLPSRLWAPMVWMGGISSEMFALHPTIRFYIAYNSEGYGSHLLIITYFLLSILAAWLFKTLWIDGLAKKLDQRFFKSFTSL